MIRSQSSACMVSVALRERERVGGGKERGRERSKAAET